MFDMIFYIHECFAKYLKSRIMILIAIVAQLVEHIHGKDEVRGSIPRNGSLLHNTYYYVSQRTHT